MSIDLFKIAFFINTLVTSFNFRTNVKQRNDINNIKEKLSYIQDDISWIESTEINKLLSDQANLRSTYEKELAKLFSDKQRALELDLAISNLTSSGSFSDPKVYDIMLASINNIDLLLSSTSETLMQLFDINEATLDKVLDLISEINSLKLRFNLDIADLQLKISDNSRLIIKLSEQQLAHQLSTFQKFEALKDDLEIINAQVDKKLADFGVLSTNTTGVILADGSFKLADTLSLVESDVFDITISETISGTSTSNGLRPYTIRPEEDVKLWKSNIPHVTGYDRGSISGKRYANAIASCSKLNLLTSTLIKKFNKKDHSGVGLLLNRPYKLLISGINPQRELFLFLKGAGLSDFNDSGLSVEFIPSLVRKSSISSVKNLSGESYIYVHSYGSSSLANVDWGLDGSYKIPASNEHIKIGTVFTTSVVQKSDELIVVKVKLTSNYSSVLTSGQISGAVVSGSGVPSSFNGTAVSGHFYSIPNLNEILAAGSFIINLPVNHLSFAGVECAQ